MWVSMKSTNSKAPTRGIAILGSTGSIGTQALDVIREQSKFLHVEVLSAGRNADLLIKQALEFKPNAVVIAEPSLRDKVFDAFHFYDLDKSLVSTVDLNSFVK